MDETVVGRPIVSLNMCNNLCAITCSITCTITCAIAYA